LPSLFRKIERKEPELLLLDELGIEQWVRLEVATATPAGQRSSWTIGNPEVGKWRNRLLGQVAISALRQVPVKRDFCKLHLFTSVDETVTGQVTVNGSFPGLLGVALLADYAAVICLFCPIANDRTRI
jgi:hypothetical protein